MKAACIPKEFLPRNGNEFVTKMHLLKRNMHLPLKDF